jgi:hypothetical protein
MPALDNAERCRDLVKIACAVDGKYVGETTSLRRERDPDARCVVLLRSKLCTYGP